MSGIKQATVSNSLKKTLELVRAGLSECSARAKGTGEIGKKELEQQFDETQKVSANLCRELPADLKPFLNVEDAQFKALVQRHDLTFDEAKKLKNASGQKASEYESQKAQSDSEINRIQVEADRIQKEISTKYAGYCDKENEEAKKLRNKAESLLEQMRRNVSLCNEEQQLTQQSSAKINAALKLAQLAQQEYDRLVNLGKDRQEQHRIAEENKRNALILNGDLNSLKQRIENKNYTKFGSDVYSAAERKELAEISSMINAGKYDAVLDRAAALKGRLAAAAEKIENKQIAWENAKHEAEFALGNARAELTNMNQNDLNVYSGTAPAEIKALYDSFDMAEKHIVEESFSAASTLIADSIIKLRSIAETALSNKEKVQRREEIAQCIAQALYDSNYDEPVAYLKEEDNELSDFCIKADAPNHIADFIMKIDLSGKVHFEVDHVPEGNESLCINAIRKLQENLGPEVRFDMTDWGRAENQGKEHIDTRPVTRTKTIEKERTKQG